MATTLVSDISNVSPWVIRPPVGEAWCITDFFSDIRIAGGIPDLQVAMTSAGFTDSLIIIDPGTAIQDVGRNFEIYINRDTYLTVTEMGAASVMGFVGHKVIPEDVMSRIVRVPNAAPAKWDVRPPVGEVWKVTEIGAEIQTAVQNDPDVNMSLDSATVAGALIATGLNDPIWHKSWEIYISNGLFLSFDSITAGDNDIALSIVRVPVEFVGAAAILLQNANVDVQPPEGDEWVITTWACDRFGGAGPPADSLDMRVSMTDGALTTTISSEASVIIDAIASRNTRVEIDNTNYLNFLEPNVGAIDFAYSGYVRRRTRIT